MLYYFKETTSTLLNGKIFRIARIHFQCFGCTLRSQPHLLWAIIECPEHLDLMLKLAQLWAQGEPVNCVRFLLTWIIPQLNTELCIYIYIYVDTHSSVLSLYPSMEEHKIFSWTYSWIYFWCNFLFVFRFKCGHFMPTCSFSWISKRKHNLYHFFQMHKLVSLLSNFIVTRFFFSFSSYWILLWTCLDKWCPSINVPPHSPLLNCTFVLDSWDMGYEPFWQFSLHKRLPLNKNRIYLQDNKPTKCHCHKRYAAPK